MCSVTEVNKVITLLLTLLQKTGHAVRAIGRLSNMALMAGVHAKKGSPTEGAQRFCPTLTYKTNTDSTSELSTQSALVIKK